MPLQFDAGMWQSLQLGVVRALPFSQPSSHRTLNHIRCGKSTTYNDLSGSSREKAVPPTVRYPPFPTSGLPSSRVFPFALGFCPHPARNPSILCVLCLLLRPVSTPSCSRPFPNPCLTRVSSVATNVRLDFQRAAPPPIFGKRSNRSGRPPRPTTNALILSHAQTKSTVGRRIKYPRFAFSIVLFGFPILVPSSAWLCFLLFNFSVSVFHPWPARSLDAARPV